MKPLLSFFLAGSVLSIFLGSSIGCDRNQSSNITAASVASPAPVPAPNPDPVGMRKILFDAANDDALTLGLSAFFAAQIARGWEIEDKNPMVESITNGTVQFQGKSLPAGIIRARFKFIDRQAGQRKTEFLAFTAASDKEFGMWRAMSICYEEAKASSELEAWKTLNSFKPL